VPNYLYVCQFGHEQAVQHPMAACDVPRYCEGYVGDMPCSEPLQRVMGANLQFTFGREHFHNSTIAEGQRKEIEGAKRLGHPIEPMGRHYAGPVRV